jgi:Nucleotide modification associated domain 2
MERVMGYKMTHDNGFAPNPFHGYLSLATCKPSIRRTRVKGDWVAGFASKALVQHARARGVQLPYMGLVYLMQVTEDPLPLAAYFDDPRFAKKKPNLNARTQKLRCGDNIYSSNGRDTYRWWPNDYHPEGSLLHDTGGRNALISSKFWYFGRNALVPQEGWPMFLREKLSEGRTFYCPNSFLRRIQDYFAEIGIQPGIHASPCMWGARGDSVSGEPSCTR